MVAGSDPQRRVSAGLLEPVVEDRCRLDHVGVVVVPDEQIESWLLGSEVKRSDPCKGCTGVEPLGIERLAEYIPEQIGHPGQARIFRFERRMQGSRKTHHPDIEIRMVEPLQHRTPAAHRQSAYCPPPPTGRGW